MIQVQLTICSPLKAAILAGVLLFATVSTISAQTSQLPADEASSSSSSSADLIDAPHPVTSSITIRKTTYRPFSAFAAAVKIGTGGIGGEFATPLNNFINLRAGAQVFDHPLNFRTSGIYSVADFTIQNAFASVDIYPFHGAFHISPGVTVYGDNHLTSNLLVPGGSTFLLGPNGYTSDPTDPVTGIGRIRFGNPVSPRFTVGWGNMLPHNGGHFSVPFEIGFQYITPPTVTVTLFGSVCDNQNNCGPVNQGEEQADLKTEIDQLNSDLSPLRFYPILSIGFSYKFGH